MRLWEASPGYRTILRLLSSATQYVVAFRAPFLSFGCQLRELYDWVVVICQCFFLRDTQIPLLIKVETFFYPHCQLSNLNLVFLYT